MAAGPPVNAHTCTPGWETHPVDPGSDLAVLYALTGDDSSTGRPIGHLEETSPYAPEGTRWTCPVCGRVFVAYYGDWERQVRAGSSLIWVGARWRPERWWERRRRLRAERAR